MKRIGLLLLAMVMLIAVPCLAFDGYQGHEGQIPLCQNNKTGALKFPKVKDIDSSAGVDYEPQCNTRFISGTTTPTETLIWVDIQLKAPSLQPMTDVPEANFTGQGWTECYSDLYSNSGTPLSTIFSQCDKKYLMLACAPVGSTTFTVAAFANRNDVLTDTGAADNNITQIANGAGWYFNNSYSLGFVKAGDHVFKSACDADTSPNPEMRLCWHTGAGTLYNGWRCGATQDLSDDSAWKRVILHHD